MTANEAAIRTAYQVAENQDVAGFVSFFTDGTNLIVRDVEGVVFEFVELHAKE